MFYLGCALKIGCAIIILVMSGISELDRNWLALPLAVLFIGFGLQLTALMRHKQKLNELDDKFKQLFGR